MELRTGYKSTEVGIIPKDWEVKELGDVGDVKMCRRIFNHETTSNGAIPFYKIGTFGKEADAYISKDLYNEYRRRFSFPIKGDILISAAGTIGRTIIYNGEDAYFQDSNIVWIDNKQSIISNDFLYHIFQVVKYNTEGGTIQRLYNSILKATKFVCPTKSEQTAIATALSDADALIYSLEKLIDKKRKIKQGVMQRLLKPKEGWVKKKLGEVLKIRHGKDQKNIKNDNGKYPILGTGGLMGFTNQYLYNFESVLIGRKGTIDKPKYINSPFWTVDTLFYSEIDKTYSAKFIYYRFLLIDWYSYNEASGVPSLNAKTIESIEIHFPSTLKEQIYIAKILTDIDNEIDLIVSKLQKFKKIKSGMMQNLLTGKIRLVKKGEMKEV